jgi:protein-tyrosine-phosphatase
MNEVGIDISGQKAKQIKESFKEHFSYVVSILRRLKRKIPGLAIHAEHCSLESGRPGIG